MKRKLRELIWRLFGHPDIPPRHLLIIPNRISSITGEPITLRRDLITSQYLAGHKLEAIADMHNVTRERVRQCLWKAYRDDCR